ncbi:hypothetical protein V7S43_012328 [Phytophthora oleae]|uniref:Uncharacterized protein n=1 Tax=Phytophthora oleae TaxID=2107226 RepID=A0ABD3F6W9_9STRA
MDKLRRLVDGAADAVQDKIKSGRNELRKAANDANVRAQRAAADAAQKAQRRLIQKAEEAKDAAKHRAEDAQKAVKHKAEEVREAAATKARAVGNSMLHNLRTNQKHATHQVRKNAKMLQHSASDTVDGIKKRVHQSATEATSAAQERVRSSMSEGAQKLRRTSSSVVAAIDPRASARRVRNKLLVVGFIGIFLYGFGSAMPHAMAKYALERAKIEEEAAVQTEEVATAVKK